MSIIKLWIRELYARSGKWRVPSQESPQSKGDDVCVYTYKDRTLISTICVLSLCLFEQVEASSSIINIDLRLQR